MPADHGTPNTGDERDREVEAATDALLADSALPRYGAHRNTVERRVRIVLEAADHVRDARSDEEVDRLANDLAGDWRERAERAEADVTMWKTRLVEETARLRELLRADRSPQGEDHEAAEAKVLEVMASPSYATATDEQRAKWIVNHMARDGTVAVEDVRARTIAEVVAFLRTYIDEEDALAVEAEFGVSERTERIHDQATKEEEQ